MCLHINANFFFFFLSFFFIFLKGENWKIFFLKGGREKIGLLSPHQYCTSLTGWWLRSILDEDSCRPLGQGLWWGTVWGFVKEETPFKTCSLTKNSVLKAFARNWHRPFKHSRGWASAWRLSGLNKELSNHPLLMLEFAMQQKEIFVAPSLLFPTNIDNEQYSTSKLVTRWFDSTEVTAAAPRALQSSLTTPECLQARNRGAW